MMPPTEPVVSDTQLPQRVDVVVIGGGIIGVSAAYFLAKSGRSVALVEKGPIAHEQSSRNWGWCRTQNRDERELPLQLVSMELWDSLPKAIGADMGFRRNGLVYATKSATELATWSAWIDMARKYQVRNRVLTGAETKALTPGNEQDWLGGIQAPTDGRAEPTMAAPALATAARKLGVTLLQDCAVRGLDIAGGRIAGVITERGRIAADRVLCAGGAWASMFCRRHGIDLPQAGIRSTVFATTPGPQVTKGGLVTPDFTLTPRLDGSYIVAALNRGNLQVTPQGIRYARQFWPTFRERRKSLRVSVGSSLFTGPEALVGKWSFDAPSPFERHRVYAPTPDPRVAEPALKKLKSVYPALSGVGIGGIWAGWIDVTPDSVPVISPVDALPGFFLATGFSGHGFGIGPAAGKLAAELTAGDAPCVDPKPFRYSRLVDGSDLSAGSM
ncbi:MAG: FAD-binding oxidoreductase [Alphaproteobacteria bacterium]|nr:FAD-binding oxidoreductase [Alphaproteobacteria bacterium]